jgi:hypothetical protein
MQSTRNRWMARFIFGVTWILATSGCSNTPIDVSDFSRGPAPRRMPSPGMESAACDRYEDSLTGGQIFTMYCSYCHNAPSLAERPFSNFQNVAAHMRVRANLTGKEYAKLVAWLRRWHDVPGPELHDPPSPKRFIFGQPIPELREQQTGPARDPVSGPRPGAVDETSPGQPPPGSGPRESR